MPSSSTSSDTSTERGDLRPQPGSQMRKAMEHDPPAARTTALIAASAEEPVDVSRTSLSGGENADSGHDSPPTKIASRGRPTAPKLLHRQYSGTIIVPRDKVTAEADESYGPDDARAMSPRRNSEETLAMAAASRSALREHARQVQLSLVEIAESIELVKADHDKLEKQNLALQDYIGGLTRSMSKTQSKSKR